MADDAQNSATSAKKPRGRPFKPGISGNPGGRPKGLMQRVRELTSDGNELVDLALSIARGQMTVLRPGNVEERPTIRDRMAAIEWLGDRGFGKATQALELLGKDGERLSLRIDLGER